MKSNNLILFFLMFFLLISCGQSSTELSNKVDEIGQLKIDTASILDTSIINNKATNNRKKSNVAVFNLRNETIGLNNYFKKYELKPQKFIVSTDTITEICGEKGLRVFVNPRDLEFVKINGLSNIEVQILELHSKKELFAANASTISNNQVLNSGGAYNIDLLYNNKSLRLKKDKSLKVKIPIITSDNMSLFYGERDSVEVMNWSKSESLTASSKKIKTYKIKIRYLKNDKMIDELIETTKSPNEEFIFNLKREKLGMESFENTVFKYKINDSLQGFEKYYDIIKLKKIGWINVDKLITKNLTPVNLVYNKVKEDGLLCAFLVFKNYNSIIKLNWSLSTNDNFVMNNIPIGEYVKLIVIKSVKGTKSIYYKEFKITENQTIEIDLKDSNDDSINKIFEAI